MVLIAPVKWMKTVFLFRNVRVALAKETMDYSSKEISFTPANKDYVPECQGLVLCDGLSSRREIKDSKGKTMRLRCVNSQCIEEEVQPEQEKSTGQR